MPPKQKMKAELKQQVEELTQKLKEAEERIDGDVEAKRDEALERAEEAEWQTLNVQRELDLVKQELEEARKSHDHEVQDKSKEAETDLATSKDHANQLKLELDDANDRIDQLEWRLEQREYKIELRVAKAKDRAQEDHRKELEARDELITLLKEKLQRLSPAEVRPSVLGSGCTTTSDKENKKNAVGEKKASDSTSTASGRTVRVNLPPLPTFSGDESKGDEDSFDRWIRKLEKYAELEQWSDREKLLQLELRLKGRAEQVFNVLPKESVCDFSTAVDSLRKRLAPVRREALLSAQLIKRKQKHTESVDQYAQDFETLFDRSYGRRSGMDQESKDLLKWDLFILGLAMKWQEKVLLSAKDFGDCLHQARAAEEQERQLKEIHHTRSAEHSKSLELSTKETP